VVKIVVNKRQSDKAARPYNETQAKIHPPISALVDLVIVPKNFNAAKLWQRPTVIYFVGYLQLTSFTL
tara:strand:+ start:287 stop:490 length:204 start_codon:yes stop_codon:yes gene_type:complete